MNLFGFFIYKITLSIQNDGFNYDIFIHTYHCTLLIFIPPLLPPISPALSCWFYFSLHTFSLCFHVEYIHLYLCMYINHMNKYIFYPYMALN